MPEALGVALAIYLGGGIVTLGTAAIGYSEDACGMSPESKRLCARLILLSPFWPVAVPILMGRQVGRGVRGVGVGIGRLWRTAVRR